VVELLNSGGIFDGAIRTCFVSVLALAIILERFWSLLTSRIAPPEALERACGVGSRKKS